jgi:hypothetical protein
VVSEDLQKSVGIILRIEKLGHRNIQNTMVYTRLVDWDQPDNWIVKRPQISNEEDELIEAGFEYVCFDGRMEMPIFRKRKWLMTKNLTLCHRAKA